MAINIPGMNCSLCARPMKNGDDISGFPAFIANKRDPLYHFSDGAFHRHCLEAHPLARSLEQRYEKWKAVNRPNARICRITGELITDPDNYLGFGFLVDNSEHELFPFNWAHFSRNALSKWEGRHGLVAAVRRLYESGNWEGEALPILLEDIESLAQCP